MLSAAGMMLKRVIVDLQACLADAEWERAQTYFDELHAALQESVQLRSAPRLAGAIVHTLTSVERALADQQKKNAEQALCHIGYLLDECARGDGQAMAE